MAGVLEVLVRMTILGIVATPDVATDAAQPQVNPVITHLKALDTALS